MILTPIQPWERLSAIFNKGVQSMSKSLLCSLALAFFCVSCVTTGTSLLNTASSTSKTAAQPAADSGSNVLSSPTTYRNTPRNFQFTLPAGWEPVADPDSESILSMRAGTPRSLNIHMEQMVPSFPRDAAVQAGLKQDKERMQINKVETAVRRDDGSIKQGCGVIGWEQTEMPQKNGYRRIIWQAYDGENYYFNFMAATENEDFEAARAELRQIMDSVRFCE